MSSRFWAGWLFFVPLGAVTSQTLLDVALVVLFSGFLFELYKKRQSVNSNAVVTDAQVPWIGIEWAFAGYLLVIILGFIFVAAPGVEVGFALKKFVWIANFYLLIYAFQRARLKPMPMLYWFSGLFLAPNIYAISTYFTQYDPIAKTNLLGRVIGMVSSATYHAHGNAVVFVFFSALLYFYFRKLTVRMKVLAAMAYGLWGLSIFLTFTRGIWLAIFVSSFLMLLLLSFRKAALLVMTSLLVFTAAYYTWPAFRETVTETGSRKQSDERENLLMTNYKIFFDHPFLGLGYTENTRRIGEYWDELAMPENYIKSHAHNQFINVLAGTGVFGLFFFICFIYFFLKKNWLLLRSTNRMQTPFRYSLLFACFWAQFEFLLACLTDVAFEYAKIRSLLILVWALVIALEIKPSIAIENET